MILCFCYSKIMYIKEGNIINITVKLGAFISCNYTASHLLSIKKILKCKN